MAALAKFNVETQGICTSFSCLPLHHIVSPVHERLPYVLIFLSPLLYVFLLVTLNITSHKKIENFKCLEYPSINLTLLLLLQILMIEELI